MKVTTFIKTGLAIGFTCTTFFMILFMGLTDITKQILLWYIASILFGITAMIFILDKWSFIVKLAIHFFISSSITFMVAYLCYKLYVFQVMAIFIITYAFITGFIFIKERIYLNRINKKLKNM